MEPTIKDESRLDHSVSSTTLNNMKTVEISTELKYRNDDTRIYNISDIKSSAVNVILHNYFRERRHFSNVFHDFCHTGKKGVRETMVTGDNLSFRYLLLTIQIN